MKITRELALVHMILILIIAIAMNLMYLSSNPTNFMSNYLVMNFLIATKIFCR